MLTKPFFSVVIPLFNKENYIEASLKSVLNQNYSNFEVIIINDGSTDHSRNKVELIKDKRIKLFNFENKGLSAARNKGISKAEGKVIALLDADDLWHESFLESIYNLYSNFPKASFYGTDYLEKYSNTNILETKKNIKPVLKDKSFLIDDFFTLNKFQSIVCQSSIAFKKEISETELFDAKINYAEDVDFYLKTLIKHKLAYLYTPLTTILCNVPNQITKTGIKNKTLPDLNKYEKENPNNTSLKAYLDFKRYMYAIQYKIINDKINFKKLTTHINFNNLSRKQQFLLKCPLIILKVIKVVKKVFLKYNIRLTSFN